MASMVKRVTMASWAKRLPAAERARGEAAQAPGVARALRGLLAGLLGLGVTLAPGALRAELAAEPVPKVEKLPKRYGDSWLYVLDVNFPALLDAKGVLLDLAAKNRNYKANFGASQFASLAESRTRSEFYVAETFYSRGVRGERSDFITIYDKASAAPVAEIELPKAKRGLVVTQKGSFRLTGDDKLGLIFNFTPAASVTVVDMVKREVLGEVPIPGCSLVYPTGRRGFSTLCGNGTLASFVLDAKGAVQRREVSEAFNDIDGDALFMKTGDAAGLTHFPTFTGNVRPVNLRGEVAQVGEAWSLVSAEERAAGWRPGGWQVISGDARARIYVLMHEGGKEGSHKSGGSEVWVFDARKQGRVRRIVLDSWGISVEATRGRRPYLAVTNADLAIDVYDARSGAHLRTIGGGLAGTPLTLYATRGRN